MRTHLKHSLKLIVIMIMLASTVILLNRHYVMAIGSDIKDIIIETEVKKLYTKETQIKVKIIVKNKELLNENTYLSYHVYNRDGEEVQYENERLPISLNANEEILLDLLVNLSNIPNKLIKKGAVIKFDIVDEKQAYWFSMDKTINMDNGIIVFENNYIKRVGFELKNEIMKNPIIFSINIIFLLLVIIIIWIIKKKNIFEL